MTRLTFEQRNNSYNKHSDVSNELVNKYKSILPEELIDIWLNMGFGIFEDGFLQLVNPEEFAFAFKYVDKLLEPSIVWGVTALGDLLIWEGNENWTIAPDEGSRVVLINVRDCKSEALGDMDFVLNFTMGDKTALVHKSYFNSKAYLDIKDKLPPLQYGQCYGYVPALVLGGSKSNKNLQVIDVKSYIDIIGQSVGKIIDLESKD